MRHNNGEQYQPRHEDNHEQDIHQDNIELQQEEELIQTKLDFENDQELAASEVQTVFFFMKIKISIVGKTNVFFLNIRIFF